MVASNVPGPVTTLPPTEKLPCFAMTSGLSSAFPLSLSPAWAWSSPLPPARAIMDAAKAKETALRYGLLFMSCYSSRVLVGVTRPGSLVLVGVFLVPFVESLLVQVVRQEVGDLEIVQI